MHGDLLNTYILHVLLMPEGHQGGADVNANKAARMSKNCVTMFLLSFNSYIMCFKI